MPDDATQIADRLEAALTRIEQARAAATARLHALEAVVEGSVADLDQLLATADRR